MSRSRAVPSLLTCRHDVRDQEADLARSWTIKKRDMLSTSHHALLGATTALLALTLLAGSPHAQSAAPTSAEGSAFSVTPYLLGGRDGRQDRGRRPAAG